MMLVVRVIVYDVVVDGEDFIVFVCVLVNVRLCDKSA